MKKYLFALLLAVTSLSACKKDSDNSSNYDAAAQAAIDDAKIQAYIKANNITASKDPSGVYYQIITPGKGDYPISSSTVNVNYKGQLLDGTVFDTHSGVSFALSSVIAGWQIGIPYINTGGRILLIIPSTLGYRNVVNGSIPANSVLIFTIDLLGFRQPGQ